MLPPPMPILSTPPKPAIPPSGANTAIVTMINRLKDFLARGGAWTTIQFLILASVVGLGQWFPQDWPRALALTGWVVFAAGGIVFLAGFTVLGRNLSPYTQPRPGGQLVRRGIYTRLRHPLYTGV